ncbi:MAG: hypothetical protein NUV80_02400 [Candidatus Berkelbacteria bacterium]|nr:hypothetical protein [Candidatus Berkelbacteria bacterium]MCR4307384.1 hypothetical protein [Candidatus Berkelbacteria bacterium]
MKRALEFTVQKENSWYIATHPETGMTSQGETKKEAIANLYKAIALHRGLSPDLYIQLERVFNDYDGALKALADR